MQNLTAEAEIAASLTPTDLERFNPHRWVDTKLAMDLIVSPCPLCIPYVAREGIYPTEIIAIELPLRRGEGRGAPGSRGCPNCKGLRWAVMGDIPNCPVCDAKASPVSDYHIDERRFDKEIARWGCGVFASITNGPVKDAPANRMAIPVMDWRSAYRINRNTRCKPLEINPDSKFVLLDMMAERGLTPATAASNSDVRGFMVNTCGF